MADLLDHDNITIPDEYYEIIVLLLEEVQRISHRLPQLRQVYPFSFWVSVRLKLNQTILHRKTSRKKYGRSIGS